MSEQELTTLISEYGKDIFSFCLRLCQTRYEAEELYQDTFLKLIEKSNEIDRSKNPKSFIFSLAIGIYRNQKKKYAIRHRIAPTTTLDEHMSEFLPEGIGRQPEEEFLQKELKERIRYEISLLDNKYRIPLLMHYTGNLTHAETGSILRLPKGTIFISPYIKGENPALVNAFTLNGSYCETVQDGILYRILECDTIEMFADRGVYLYHIL